MDYERSAAGVYLPQTSLKVGGTFHGTIVRDGRIIDEFEDHNLVVNEGLNSILGVMLNASTQITTWYIAPFEGNYTPVATVTAATITAAATECTAYDESTRVAYVEAAPSSQSITNSASRATFTFNASKTIYGAFIISASTKSATSGTLLAASRFSSSKAVEDDDQLLLTYTFTAASA